MTIKKNHARFFIFILVGFTSILQSEKTIEDHNRSNEMKMNQDSVEQSIKLKDALIYLDSAVVKNIDLNDTQGALVDYNQAISLDPKFSLAYLGRASLKAFKLNDPQGALADYDQAISLDPKFSLAYLGRAGLKAFKLYDRRGAVQDLRQVAQLSREQGNTQYLQEAINGLRKLGTTE
jgi:tetratricopeptide (TPR) repeat protein